MKTYKIATLNFGEIEVAKVQRNLIHVAQPSLGDDCIVALSVSEIPELIRALRLISSKTIK